MTIKQGDFVRPINTQSCLPLGTIWLVVHAERGLRLEPFNHSAKDVDPWVFCGKRFLHGDFEQVVPGRRGRASELRECDWMASNDAAVREFLSQPIAPSKPATAVGFANARLTSATNAAKEYQDLLQAARALEVESRAALREAKLAQAKAEKEAVAKAKVEEAKRQLAARLHADRRLADATLELIGEVSRLNNGGPERAAPSGIAMHAAQLQPLAKSYGYRIVKPSMLAQVVKL